MPKFEASRCESQRDAALAFRRLVFDYLNQQQSALWSEIERGPSRQSGADAGAQIRMIADIKLYLCKLDIL
jgi:hypothetical protein